jgi:NAD(P)H-dependent flavin oxidoreductase YrpB (nitropropane dioxygenase family)
MLETSLCRLLDIELPILQAGMGRVAYGEITGTVSEAGGLGFIGGIDITPTELEAEIAVARKLTDKPIGVDLGFPVRAPQTKGDVEIPPAPEPIVTLRQELAENGVTVADSTDQAISASDAKEKLEIALGAGVEAIVCALGTPGWAVEMCHERDAKVISLVGSTRGAERSIQSGTDAIIACGYEAGGHIGRIGLLTLLTEVLEFFDGPVVGAGGIVKGSQIAAVLTAGGAGVWVGTRFLATQESRAPDVHKKAVLEVPNDKTIRSNLFDGLGVRFIRNRFTDVWEGRDSEIADFPLQRLYTAPIWHAAAESGMGDYMPLSAGQGSGMINELPSAADVVRALAEETEAAIETAHASVVATR